ncbi:MAG TPA: aromatic acid exporter family protein, partial [Virgibacillus sp.]|nr:aromatic acid exporter family protein [Virgibacillus sp.]
MKRFQSFAGGRVVKTGVAIFLTAWICELLHWPPVFAVITAIVTIEPTVSDSIKKGVIRFPASAIGSAYAVFFISLFGNSPITYTLAAVFTIATCFKLKLHAGLLVATLTSVAMVEVIHGNYLVSFFIRLGTTTTGLLVSTLVNMFILPPDYTKEIVKNVQTIGKKTGITIAKVFRDILENK